MISKTDTTISSNASILENEVSDDEMYFDFKISRQKYQPRCRAARDK